MHARARCPAAAVVRVVSWSSREPSFFGRFGTFFGSVRFRRPVFACARANMSQPSVIRNVLARLFKLACKSLTPSDESLTLSDKGGAPRRATQIFTSSAARAATRPRDRTEVNCSRDRCEWDTWSLLGPQKLVRTSD